MSAAGCKHGLGGHTRREAADGGHRPPLQVCGKPPLQFGLTSSFREQEGHDETEAPAALLRRRAFVPNEKFVHRPRDTFVEQNLHAVAGVSRADSEHSKTPHAIPRVTDGKYSKSVLTGTRVPLNTGVPPRMFGSTVINSFDFMSDFITLWHRL